MIEDTIEPETSTGKGPRPTAQEKYHAGLINALGDGRLPDKKQLSHRKFYGYEATIDTSNHFSS